MDEVVGVEAVSETLFLPLYALALESQRDDPILADPGAVALTGALNHARCAARKKATPSSSSTSLSERTPALGDAGW